MTLGLTTARFRFASRKHVPLQVERPANGVPALRKWDGSTRGECCPTMYQESRREYVCKRTFSVHGSNVLSVHVLLRYAAFAEKGRNR